MTQNPSCNHSLHVDLCGPKAHVHASCAAPPLIQGPLEGTGLSKVRLVLSFTVELLGGRSEKLTSP